MVGGLILLGLPAPAAAQAAGAVGRPAARVAAALSGAIYGFVLDDAGEPVSGAVVSAIGATSAFAVTDKNGRYELQTLTPGPYVVRAHQTGFSAPRPQIVDVRPSARAASMIALSRPDERPVLAAGFGAAQPGSTGTAGAADEAAAPDDAGDDSHSETAWRLAHARRGILKNVIVPAELIADDGGGGFGTASLFDLAASPARLATNFFASTPFSGQVNLLTSGSFDTPQQLFSSDAVSRGIAYVKVGAPVGRQGDWAMRGAFTQADLSAWIVAGSYTTRAPARHQYDIGMSYSTQRYDGGNPLALRDVTDGSRNVGEVYAYDAFALTPAITVTAGGRYARYDYLEHRRLISPRVEVTITPVERLRISGVVSRRAQAPGAEEFLPPGDSGIWLPPQRTFSSIEPGQGFRAEQTTHAEVQVAKDIAASTIAFRVFRQHVDDQLVTLFGAQMPLQPSASVGHYFVGNAGDAQAAGCAWSFETTVARRVHGSVAYSMTQASLEPDAGLRYLLLVAPSAVRPESERIHDLATTIQADVPETLTRVVMLYRVSNGFARPAAAVDAPVRPGVESRFDVQVRQSLPFLNFTSAKWEMLVAVRDFFREASAEQSVYDELLVVRPPKRIVGGVTLHF
jgi:hypothetical protein